MAVMKDLAQHVGVEIRPVQKKTSPGNFFDLEHPDQVPTANFNELNPKINLLGCSVLAMRSGETHWWDLKMAGFQHATNPCTGNTSQMYGCIRVRKCTAVHVSVYIYIYINIHVYRCRHDCICIQ